MKLAELLSTPYPQHAFVLDGERLAYGRLTRRRDGFERTEAVDLPGGWCTLGPVGLLHADRNALSQALGGLLERLDHRPQSASLVMPNGWVRTVAVDVGDLPRQRQEAEEVVLWRLKKLLPCRPEDVRLDYLPTGANGRVLVVLTLDKPLADIEAVFAEAGIHLGRLVPAVVALTALLPAGAGARLLAMVESGTLALAATAGGALKMVRTKGLPGVADQLTPLLQRELSQTVTHLREHAGGGSVTVHVVAAGKAALAAATEWALGEPEVAVQSFPGEETIGGAAVDDDELRAWLLLAAGRERVS